MFSISTRGEYGLMLMSTLAQKGHFVSLGEIARESELPFYYLVRLASLLKKAGLIESQKGRSGGYRLAKAPQEISILEVLQALEGSTRVMNCLTGAYCQRQATCTTAGFWKEISGQVEDLLFTYTLADINHGKTKSQ